MMPYTSGIILDKANNYGIVKTETVFGFGSPNGEAFVNRSFNTTEPLEWIFSQGNIDRRSFKDPNSSRVLKNTSKVATLPPKTRSNINNKKLGKKHKKRKGKAKKCILNLIEKGKKTKRRRGKMRKKYMLPLILGLLAAKSLLIPIALKALAFISAKGLIMGFFSTMLASVLSLKGMFEHSHAWNRKDDTKTQVEIIQVPSKNDEHIYYDDTHYTRSKSDYIPPGVMK